MDRHGLIWIDGDSSEMRQPTLDSGLSLGNSFKQVALHRITHEDVNREWCIYVIITCTYMYNCIYIYIYTHFILYTSVHKSTYDKHVFFQGEQHPTASRREHACLMVAGGGICLVNYSPGFINSAIWQWTIPHITLDVFLFSNGNIQLWMVCSGNST